MSQRTAKPKLMRRPENLEARRLAACVQTPADLEELLASLPNDKQRAEAARVLMPHLPQFIHKRGSQIVVRISDAPSEKEPNN
jgi:hypothetical protein